MKASRQLNATLQKEALVRIAAWRQDPSREVACPACDASGLSIADRSARPFVEWYKLTCKACGLSESLHLVLPTPARILD